MEAHADLILRLLAETPDATVAELRAALTEHGQNFGYGTLRRFFQRRAITRRKRRRTPARRTARTS